MKIDFRKIQVKDIEGNNSTIDASKHFANAIYQNTGDIGELELAREMYNNGEIELSLEQAESLKKYVKAFQYAFVQLAINEVLDGE